MESAITQERQRAHAFLDRLPQEQLSAVSSLLETMLSPLDRKLALAPLDDEPVTEEERREIEASGEWFKHNEGTPFEQVVADLGFTMEEVTNYKDPS